ncbi:MAG TPA: hypothetical protein VK817_16190 [Trebonia sp.]|nr:hypothetical protein [Trebonia sp.]
MTDLSPAVSATLAALLRDLAAGLSAPFPETDYEPMGEAVRQPGVSRALVDRSSRRAVHHSRPGAEPDGPGTD